MGRRPLAQKRQTKSPTSTPVDVEKGPKNLNPENAGLQSETTKPQPKTQTKSAGLTSTSKQKKCDTTGGPRRSGRLLTALTPQEEEIERIIDEMTMSEGEEAKQKSLEEKVDYLLQHFLEQQRTIEAIKLKLESNSSPSGSPQTVDMSYRNLYLDSQKKIEALTDENNQLALKLEHVLGKLEAFENGACVFSQGLDKLKDMILCTNLGKATETAMKFSPQAFTSADAGTEAKTCAKRSAGAGAAASEMKSGTKRKNIERKRLEPKLTC